MRSKAFDNQQIVHLTDWKGAPFATCVDGESTPEDATRVSPLFLSADTPVTCVKCIAIEASTPAPEEDEDDDP